MNRIIREFNRLQLKAWGVPYECGDSEGSAEELHRAQIDTRRWTSVHELVFRAPDDGLPYRVTYEEGLTELQEDTDPWNFELTIMGEQVEKRLISREEWHPVTS
jgi:hypothetical protein